jgi:periplasmic protein TonB
LNVETQRSHLRYSDYSQFLNGNQLRVVTAAIVGLHLVAGWGLLQVEGVRKAVMNAAPVFFEVVPVPALVPPPPEPQRIPRIVPPAPLISTPAPVESTFVTEPAESETLVVAPEPAAIQALPEPPAPSPPPKMIPASAVQYLVPPPMEYPRASRPFRESGRVIARVYVDEMGMPKLVQISKSSGYPRLDEAGVRAVQKARFKPYTENGQPTAGWALIPLNFELER